MPEKNDLSARVVEKDRRGNEKQARKDALWKFRRGP